MFNIFKKNTTLKTNSNLPFENVKVDMHSHILPGIDDGAQTVEDSLKLIETLVNKGIEKFVCTPHIYKELYPNTKETAKDAYERLLPHAKEKFPNIEIRYAAEYYMDESYDELVENSDLMQIWDRYVLVEHSFMQLPPDIKDKVFNLQMAGYIPIIAHPERYEFYSNYRKAYHSLFDLGCIFQVNLLSLEGYYGKVPLESAKYLIKNKMINLVGSDIHHERHMNAYRQFSDNSLLKDLIQQDQLLNTTIFT